MKSIILLRCGLGMCMQCALVWTLNAQAWNKPPAGFDPEVYTEVQPGTKPSPLSCEAGMEGRYKVRIEIKDNLSAMLTEEFPLEKGEWTDEDMQTYDEEYNRMHRGELRKQLEELDDELDDPVELFYREFAFLVRENDWDKLCREDCVMGGYDCDSRFFRDFIDASMSARFETPFYFIDDDPDPDVVHHSIQVSVRYTGWVYFRMQCKCRISDEAISNTNPQESRVGTLAFEPVTFEAGPDIDPGVLAWFTYEVLPGDDIVYLNARFSEPSNDTEHWLVQNIPLPPFGEPQVISTFMNIESLSPGYDQVQCTYAVGDWQTSPDFPATGTTQLTPQPAIYNVPSGSGDASLDIPGIMAAMPPPGGTPPGHPDWKYRGCDIPNIDLDCSKDRTDSLACGPASAANSLQWLIKQHPELAGDLTSHRAKMDSLKKYMNKDLKKGVRFDSMVVGKLTLIDKLKLPIHVKYQTSHKTGNTKEPLTSTASYKHTAKNHGKIGVPPDFDWVKSEIDKGEDVEVQVGWYGIGTDGRLERFGGHWVVVTGYYHFDNGMVKGIWIKDDNDQCAKGGLRNEFHKWGPGNPPQLEGLTDGRGNIAIIESAVSESYDPSIKFDDESSVDSPWDVISLTDTRMKPGYPFAERGFRWLPIIGGVTGAGVITTILLTRDDDQNDCNFTVTATELNPGCGMAAGGVILNVTPTGNYTYEWSNGASTQSISGLFAGTYTVTVTRTGTSCTRTLTATLDDISVVLVPGFTTEDAHCGANDGSATVSVMPELSYTYSWSNGGSGNTHTDLAPGAYSVTATHGTCQTVIDLTIGELPPLFNIEITPTSASCGMEDGSAIAIVTPDENYTYLWSNGQTTSELSDVAPGIYELTVTIAGTNCQKTTSVGIGENPADLELTITTTPAGCGLSDGSVSVTIIPDGNYDYLWSNGAMTSEVSDLPAGDYTVTVTKQGTDCVVTGTITVDEEPADFNITITTTPGNCLGEGANIVLEIQSPGFGQMEIVATGPDGPHTITVPQGTVSLNKHFTLLPGNWSITVRDISLPEHCTQQFTADIEEITQLLLTDDSYTTTVDQNVTGNILDNDSGLQIQVTDHTQPSGGTLVQNSDGSFTFTPPPGEPGEFTYQYTVTDACGNTSTATVTIQVTTIECTFEATFTTVPADCGLSTGSITAMVMPEGVYTFQWSNGEMSQDLNNLTAGQYSVTVTSADQMCDKTYTIDVVEMLTTYIANITTSPGNCTGEGEITITLETPGQGPLVVTIDGPGGTVELMLDAGQHDLSSSMNIPSGDYTITVYDQGAGKVCVQTMDISVSDNTPDLVPADDFYETTFNTPTDGNMLDNDEGLDPEVIAIGTVTGGTVNWNADGSFTFTPDAGFTGTAEFTYTVRDACGNESEALVEIIVGEAICDFTAQFINTNADCGFASGTAFVEVDLSGTYFYQWSNGDTGPMLEGLSAGIYSVTIEDLELNCSLEFETEIFADPAEYITDIQVIQPECPETGDVIFNVSSFGGGPFDITVTHPNGIEVFIAGSEQVSLSDFLEIVDGDYTIVVVDQNTGPECNDSFDATITGTTTIVIDVETIFPPSEPSSMDGAILVAITMPGTPPYTILLNGEVWGVSDDPFVATIEGLGAGMYTVQLQDANGCLSNILGVEVPFPGMPGLQIGFGFINWDPAPTQVPEIASGKSYGFVRSYLEASLNYRLGGMGHESSIRIVPDGNGTVMLFSQFVQLWEEAWKGLSLRAQGGVIIDQVYGQTDARWVLRGSASKRIGKLMYMNARLSLQERERVLRPVGEIGVRVGLLHASSQGGYDVRR